MPFIMLLGIGLMLMVGMYFLQFSMRPLYVGLIASIIIGAFGLNRYFNTRRVPVVETNNIIVGICADFEPFTFIDNGFFRGLDIDLMNEIAQRLHKTITWQNMPFGTLIPSLQLGTIQVIAAGLTTTPERAKHVLFTEPYVDNDPLVLVSNVTNPVNSLEETRNKTVAVSKGYTADTYMSAQPNVMMLRLSTPADVFLALLSKRADVFVAASKTLRVLFAQYGKDNFKIVEIPGTAENASFAIAPSCPGLRDEIDAILTAMKKDGTLDKLKAKWKVS